MNKLHKCIVTAAIALWSAVSLAAIPSRPYPPRLVNDFAGILTPAQTVNLERVLTAFSDSTSNQIAVVTVLDLEGYSPAEYATELGQSWGVGTEKFDNGIVVLVKPKTANSFGEVNISVGYGLEGAIPDSYAKRIIEYEMIPQFKTGDYYGGISKACIVLMKLASGEISEVVEPFNWEGLISSLILIIFIIVFIVAVIKNKGNGGSNDDFGGGTGGRMGSDDADDFLRGLIIGNMLGGHGRGGRGGFGGGGSFGGFGGGSFGGGGASGRW